MKFSQPFRHHHRFEGNRIRERAEDSVAKVRDSVRDQMATVGREMARGRDRLMSLEKKALKTLQREPTPTLLLAGVMFAGFVAAGWLIYRLESKRSLRRW